MTGRGNDRTTGRAERQNDQKRKYIKGEERQKEREMNDKKERGGRQKEREKKDRKREGKI